MKPVSCMGLAAVSLLMSGCANLSTLQTARALPLNEAQAVLGAGLAPLPAYYFHKDSAKHIGPWPYLEAGARLGVYRNVDAGFKLTALGTFAIDGKYQFVDAGPFAMATGFGVGFIGSDSSWGDVEKQSIDFMFPLYTSVDLGDHLALYVTPRYIHRGISPRGGSVNAYENILSATTGLRIGKQRGLYIEGTFSRTHNKAERPYQVNASFFWRFTASNGGSNEDSDEQPGKQAATEVEDDATDETIEIPQEGSEGEVGGEGEDAERETGLTPEN